MVYIYQLVISILNRYGTNAIVGRKSPFGWQLLPRL